MSFYKDLVGGIDLVGAYSPGLQHMFGANGQRVVVGADPSQQAAMANLAMAQATGVVDLQPTKSRRYPLGFPTTTVTASNGTATASSQPQIPFRGERLIIPSDFAGSILINDVKVGKNSQLAAAQPLPGRAFTEFGWGVDLHLDTADVSQFISLSLQNTSSHDITFNGMLIGRAVE